MGSRLSLTTHLLAASRLEGERHSHYAPVCTLCHALTGVACMHQCSSNGMQYKWCECCSTYAALLWYITQHRYIDNAFQSLTLPYEHQCDMELNTICWTLAACQHQPLQHLVKECKAQQTHFQQTVRVLVVELRGIMLCRWFDTVGGCRSTNTSPGAGGLGHTATMARSASMALAAQAAAAASLRHQTPLTPLSVPSPSPSHATFTYTPGSFTYSGSMSATPEVLRSRRAELDGTEALSAGAQDLHWFAAQGRRYVFSCTCALEQLVATF